jgi:hypothetical protein
MLIRDIVLSEGYYGDLIDAVQDLLARYMAKEIKEIKTEKFKALLAKQGFVTSTDELIQAVDQSGFASSVDAEKIIPKGELPADMDTDAEQTVDVGNMAGDQAMQDIKADL